MYSFERIRKIYIYKKRKEMVCIYTRNTNKLYNCVSPVLKVSLKYPQSETIQINKDNNQRIC